MDPGMSHFHMLDQGTDDLALAVPVEVLEPLVYPGGTIFQASNNQAQLGLKGGPIGQRLALLL